MKAILIGIFVLALTISSCGPSSEPIKQNNSEEIGPFLFPKNSINVEIIDKYWAKFELDGECFLMHRGGFTGKGWCAITKIDCKGGKKGKI